MNTSRNMPPARKARGTAGTEALTPANLRQYQWRAIRFMQQAPYNALLLDMGLGKTVSVMSVIKSLIVLPQSDVKTVLLVAPLRVVYGVWRQEAKKWSHTKDLVFSIVHGGEKARRQALETPAHIYMINPEGLVWLIEMLKRLGLNTPGKWPFDMLVIDESSMFKAADTKRFRKLASVLHLFKRRTIMTGTPTPNSMLELWSQMYIVDMGERLGGVYFRFRERYFERADFQGYSYVLREGASHVLNRMVKDVCLRLDAKDWLDLPAVLHNRIQLTLPDAVMDQYREFEENMFLELMTSDVEAISAASLSMRCHQIANGAMYASDRETGGRTWEPLHDEKINAAKEIVEETGGNVMIAYQFRHDLERLKAAFPGAPILGSGNTPAQTEKYVREWNEGIHRVLLVHPQSAGHGLNLQHGGHTVVFFSLTWSLEQHDQLIARLHRSGQANRVIVHYLIASDTVDEAIMMALDRKAAGQRTLLNALKEYRDGKQDQRG